MQQFWSGERLETFVFNATTIEHLHRYALAQELAKGKAILDIACGDGYGSNLLAPLAHKVTGVDISSETIRIAKERYKQDNLEFIVGSATEIPLADNSIDLVVSFETIEHHSHHKEMMQEVLRVLKPSGILIMSSPDKYYYSIVTGYINPFHAKELFEQEFKELVRYYFKHTFFLSQSAGFFSLILKESNIKEQQIAGYKGDYSSIQSDEKNGPVYWIVLASNHTIPELNYKPVFSGSAILEKQFLEIHDLYQRSITYRIGKLVLSPIIILKKAYKWVTSQR
jgi:ubiquinone/menaquinone biosynthesis C-methylase UbiE